MTEHEELQKAYRTNGNRNASANAVSGPAPTTTSVALDTAASSHYTSSSSGVARFAPMRVSVANGSSVHTTQKTDRVGSLQGTGPDGGPAELSVQLLGSMVHSQFPELISVVKLVRDNKLLFVVTHDPASPGRSLRTAPRQR